jgi:hypothetical protein
MLKFVILGVASLAFVGTAVAADLPRPQPVAAAPAPVGKYPVGKYPVGKSPVGKYPVAAPAPVVTKGWSEYLFVHRQRSLGTRTGLPDAYRKAALSRTDFHENPADGSAKNLPER